MHRGARVRDSNKPAYKSNDDLQRGSDVLPVPVRVPSPSTFKDGPCMASAEGAKNSNNNNTFKNYFNEYCNSATIHGVRYLAKSNCYFIEKLFWVIALSLCMVGGTLMIIKVKEKLDTTPVLVTFAETATNVWHVPFPAVTFCPETKSRRRVFNYTKYHNIFDIPRTNVTFEKYNITDEIRQTLEALGRVCLGENSENLNSILGFGLLIDEEALKVLPTVNGVDLYNNNWEGFWRSGKSGKPGNVREKSQLIELAAVYPLLLKFIYFDTLMLGRHSKNEMVLNATEKMRSSYIKLCLRLNKEIFCEWQGKEEDCEIIMKPVWTEEGVCFTFNSMPERLIYRHHVINEKVFGENISEVDNNWNPDKGYSLNAGLNARPWRASSGVESGLLLYFSEKEKDVDYLCGDGIMGYKIILHSPVERPLLKHNFVISVPFDRSMTVTLSPNYMTMSPGLEKYEPHKRQCYLTHEKYLQHFNYYTKKSCEIECLANATLKHCGCVDFYMPRNLTTKICGFESENCKSQATNQMRISEMQTHLKRTAAGEPPGSYTTECDCLPSCVSLEYSALVSLAKRDLKRTVQALTEKTSERVDKFFFTTVSIFFKDSEFIASRRSELYGRIDFLANCGGILSLFSGFSLISLIEIVYFLTIRICSDIYGRWKRKRALSPSNTTLEN